MNKDLVLEKSISIIDSVETMTSLQISELTGKDHDKVCRDIKVLLGHGVSSANFGESEYTSDRGRTYKCYNLTKKGCLILASGYDAVLREKIINRWEELEIEASLSNKPSYMIDDPIKRAEKWIEEQKEKQALALESEKAKKHIERLTHDAKTYTTSELAKELNLKSAVALNNILHEKGIQYKQNGTWLLYSNYSDKDYTSIKQTTLDSGKIVFDRRWTSLGRDFVLNLLNNK